MGNGFTVWLTGLSGAGKTTIARILGDELRSRGYGVETLDGDEVRKNLSSGLGFSREDRDANIRRIGWVAALGTRHGAVVIAAAISPYREVRDEVRGRIGNFVEVYVKCPLEVLTRRDPKGLYKKALAGEILNFTGVSDPYEEPLNPELVIETDAETPEASAAKLLNKLVELGHVAAVDGTAGRPAPHGGRLVEQRIGGPDAADRLRGAEGLPSLELSPRELSDLQLLGCGALSPLSGFMGKADYERVLAEMRLAGGLPWPLPITLSADEAFVRKLQRGQRIALRDGRARIAGLLEVQEVFEYDKSREAREVFLTEDAKHPGVAALYQQRDLLVGGRVEVFEAPDAYNGRHLPPAQSRAKFDQLGWRTVVGFQTRNPVHRAHEYLLKVALETADGLFLNPLVGATKSDDIPAGVRMECYEALLDGFFPRDRVVLGVLPAAMRYAGPREAVFHAILRKNYGCTHFIVGRDHAGVGSYYGPYDAQRIFDRFDPSELGIKPIFFENAFYCRACGGMASSKTCPHGVEDHLVLSGTRVRELLAQGQALPAEFTRPEVAAVLGRHARGLAETAAAGTAQAGTR